jgi:hypothetical protein
VVVCGLRSVQCSQLSRGVTNSVQCTVAAELNPLYILGHIPRKRITGGYRGTTLYDSFHTESGDSRGGIRVSVVPTFQNDETLHADDYGTLPASS